MTVLSSIVVLAIPALYLFVEEREGRRKNPVGPSLLRRLALSFRKQASWFLGSVLGGIIIAFWRDDWRRGMVHTAVVVGCLALFSVHEAVTALKKNGDAK